MVEAPNPRVFGKYEVIRRLAVGGMGEIFLARQIGMAGFDRLVILKSLLPQLASEQDMLTQFLDEARIVGNINHPNVVACYEVGEWEGVYFIAMEYINGVDVAALAKAAEDNHVRFPVNVAMSLVREAALGLDSAHHASDAQGRPLRIVHRDISPHNIMLRQDGLAKIVDFGVAVAANRQKRTEGGLLKGKLGYMAPEQIKGQPLDGRSDQFSLGVLLWELLTMRRLFVAEDPHAVFMKIVRETVPPPSSLMSDVPKELDAIVLRMTAQEPTDRYPRLAETAAALRKLLDARGASESEAADTVKQLVGGALAERVRDLTPVPVKILGIQFDREGVGTSAAFCSSCGTKAVKGDRFCRSCGAALAGPKGPTPPPHVPPSMPPVPAAAASSLAPLAIDDEFAEVADDMIDVAFDDASGPSETGVCIGVMELVDAGGVHPAPESMLRAVFAHVEELASRFGGSVTTSGARLTATFTGNGRGARSAIAFARRATSLASRANAALRLRAGVGAAPGMAHADTGARDDADRASTKARAGTVLVTERAKKLAAVAHQYGAAVVIAPSPTPTAAPGSSEPLTTFEIALPPKLAGRAGERVIIEQAIAAADVARGQQHLFLGHAGLGKTALLALVDGEARDRGFVVARARALGTRVPLRYDLVRQAIQSACVELANVTTGANEQPSSGTSTWTKVLESLNLSAGDRKRLAALVDDVDAGPDDDIPLARRRILLRGAIISFFAAVADRRGVCVLVDDVHKGDPSSLEVFAEIGARLHATRFAVFAAGKPMQGERVLPLAKRTMLEPMDNKDIALVASFAVGATLSDDVADKIAAKARGNPLFATLLARHLVKNRLVSVKAGACVPSVDFAKFPLPPSIEVCSFALHALLEKPSRTALVAGALAGVAFDDADVAAMLGAPKNDVAKWLRACVQAGALDSTAAGAYAFASTSERDMVAARADPVEAARWHARLAQALADSASTRAKSGVAGVAVRLEERILTHRLAADDKAGAAVASERAAEAWVRLGAAEATIEHYRRALHATWRGLAATDDQRTDDQRSADKRVDDARAKAALDLGARATRAIGEVDASAAVDLAMPLLRAIPLDVAPDDRAAALGARAAVLAKLRRNEDAEAMLTDALHAFAHADPSVTSSLLVDLAVAQEQTGAVDLARGQLTSALDRMAALADRPRAVEALVALTRLHLRAREPAKAKETVRQALVEAERSEASASLVVDALTARAAIEQVEGNAPAALASLEQALARAQQCGDAVSDAKVRQHIARLHQQTGKLNDALTAAKQSLSTAQRLSWDEGTAVASSIVTSLEQRGPP